MRVRARSKIKSHPYYLGPNDIMSVPQEVGARWVALGWAEEVGEGEAAAVEVDAPIGQGVEVVITPSDAVHQGGNS